MSLEMMVGRVLGHTEHLIGSVDQLGHRMGSVEQRLVSLESHKERPPQLELLIKRGLAWLAALSALGALLNHQDASQWVKILAGLLGR